MVRSSTVEEHAGLIIQNWIYDKNRMKPRTINSVFSQEWISVFWIRKVFPDLAEADEFIERISELQKQRSRLEGRTSFI